MVPRVAEFSRFALCFNKFRNCGVQLQSRRSIVLSRFYRGELAELRRRSIGPDLAFGRLWEETGCHAALRRHLAGRQFGFDAERAVYLTVLHRLMVSGSDRHASAWRETVAVPGADALTLDHAYKAMAWLGEDVAAPGEGQRRSRTAKPLIDIPQSF